MTTQHPDTVLVDGHPYNLTAVEGEGLFDPEAYGLTATGMGTGCYRGHICTYALTDDGHLVLRDLEIGLEAGEALRTSFRLNGRLPVGEPGPTYDETYYQQVDLPVPFSGKLLIADGWIAGFYLNMGFQPAWRFERVLDIHFADGMAMAINDVSVELAALRERLGAAGTRPTPGEATIDWIGRAFSLSYAYSWPDLP